MHNDRPMDRPMTAAEFLRHEARLARWVELELADVRRNMMNEEITMADLTTSVADLGALAPQLESAVASLRDAHQATADAVAADTLDKAALVALQAKQEAAASAIEGHVQAFRDALTAAQVSLGTVPSTATTAVPGVGVGPANPGAVVTDPNNPAAAPVATGLPTVEPVTPTPTPTPAPATGLPTPIVPDGNIPPASAPAPADTGAASSAPADATPAPADGSPASPVTPGPAFPPAAPAADNQPPTGLAPQPGA